VKRREEKRSEEKRREEERRGEERRGGEKKREDFNRQIWREDNIKITIMRNLTCGGRLKEYDSGHIQWSVLLSEIIRTQIPFRLANILTSFYY
jgi:hypothetical protein